MAAPPDSRLSPSAPLGERCISRLRQELAAGVAAAPYPQPNTSPRVKEYLSGCLRDLNGDGIVAPTEKLGLSAGDWCAAVQGWVLEQELAPGEDRPHLWRAAVVEIELDAKLRGLFHPIDEFHRGVWSPNVGDLVLWDRSDKARPETAWHRHVNRFVGFTSPDWTHMRTIGGNESRRIQEQLYQGGSVTHPKLLGFVSYYQKPAKGHIHPTELERMRSLVALAIDDYLRG